MKTQLTYENALHKAATLCSAGEKCEYDIREKLTAWGISQSDADKIIDRLIQENFLSEERFAVAFVKDKFRFGKWGKIKIGYVLKQKHINARIIQEALENIDEDEYLSTLQHLLHAKLKNLKYKDEYDKQAKLFRFAQSRGFENAIIANIISSL